MRAARHLHWLIGIALGMALAATASAERLLATYQGLQAVVPDQATCGSTYQVMVRASDVTAFSGTKPKVRRLLGGVRAILRQECPRVKNVVIIGQVQGQEIYRGAASETGSWALVDMPAPPKKNDAQAKPQVSTNDR
jgi:hypothetical protein